MVAAGQAPAAVAQAEQRVELLDELRREPPAAQRPDRHRVARGRLGGHLEDRERNVEAAADVHEPVVIAHQTNVAGRPELLDQAVLEHERAELRLGRAIVDDRGVRSPFPGSGRRPSRGREVGSRPTADRDRLADVQRGPAGVAEQVHAGVARQLGEVRQWQVAGGRQVAGAAGGWSGGRWPGGRWPAGGRWRAAGTNRAPAHARRSVQAPDRAAGVPAGAAGAARAARPPRPRWRRWRTAAGTARTARGRTSRRRPAPGGPPRRRSPAHRRAPSVCALAAAAAAPGQARRCRAREGRAIRARRGRTPDAARAGQTERCAQPAPCLASARRPPAGPRLRGAPRRPSPA